MFGGLGVHHLQPTPASFFLYPSLLGAPNLYHVHTRPVSQRGRALKEGRKSETGFARAPTSHIIYMFRPRTPISYASTCGAFTHSAPHLPQHRLPRLAVVCNYVSFLCPILLLVSFPPLLAVCRGAFGSCSPSSRRLEFFLTFNLVFRPPPPAAVIAHSSYL